MNKILYNNIYIDIFINMKENSISKCENQIYSYDKYDIIYFLEKEYIDCWLNTIPKEIFKKISNNY